MNTSELDDLVALLGRVLPDPTGFAERLFQQAVVRWADPGQGGPSGPQSTATGRLDPRTVVITPDADAGSYERLTDTNTLLASALGACDCWGGRADCPLCGGDGSSGWTHPDEELFQIFVGPAVQKLSTAPDRDDDHDTASGTSAEPTTTGDRS